MPWTIRVQLLLEASLKGADASIKEDAMKLLKMMEAGGGGGGGSAPPFVTFKWGSIERWQSKSSRLKANRIGNGSCASSGQWAG